jgi:serine/threonine-protein kinase HipA
MENNLRVMLWGREVGRLAWDASRNRAVFEYSPDFLKGGLDIAPLAASISKQRNRLPFYGEKNDDIFYGLPSFISDSVPGRWGNAVFEAWASYNGLRSKSLTPVDRLSFIGKRAMGALEFEPSQEIGNGEMSLQLDQLYRKAQEILQMREEVVVEGKDLTLERLYEVGTSAGGQHTKAVIARNDKTGEIRSRQIMLPPEYTYYLLKFAEKDYYPLTKVEMVYYILALKAGINMMHSELIEIDGDEHFLTERYDRKDGRKIHTQTLAAMNPGARSYEDLMDVCEELGVPYLEREETFRRIVFNILTTNVDAHVRNFSFMMEEHGSWHITPAYDLTFSCFNPGSNFDTSHYLSVAGKHMDIGYVELMKLGRRFSINNPKEIIRSTAYSVAQFRTVAEQIGVDSYWIDKIEGHFAEMSPDILRVLEGYKALFFEYFIKDHNIMVRNMHWTEMGNGAMRFMADLNDVPYKATFAKSSEEYENIMSLGGIKMPFEGQKDYVERFFLPKYLLR